MNSQEDKKSLIMATIFVKRIFVGPLLLRVFAPVSIVSCPQSRHLIRTLKSGPLIKPIASARRSVDKSKTDTTDDGSFSVIAHNLSEELRIENAQKLLENFSEYQISKLPADVEEEAVMLSPKCADINELRSHQPLNDVILFREGSIVFWGVPYEQQKRILFGLSSLKINPNSSDLIQEEREHMSYVLDNSIDKSRLTRDTIKLASKQDADLQKLDQFAFSHAIALSVKLGVLEMVLDEYIESVEWITENMKQGKDIKLTKSQVFKKTGEILCLKHSINLSSNLLDLPDVYWDRNEQEEMFASTFGYLNIRKRTNVMNEKLNNCCELMNLLAGHMNDQHHIRLEWMIIALITVEVLFEVSHFF